MRLQFIDNMSVRWKLLLAVVIPILAMCGFAAEFLFQQYSHSQKMERLQRVSSFSIVASEAIHELQRERGRSAGYVGSKGSASYLKSLNAQRGRSDTALNKLESVIEEDLDLFKGNGAEEHILKLQNQLSKLKTHRDGVTALKFDLGGTVSPYTQSINTLISVVLDSTRMTGSDETAATMAGVLALMRAKENAGLERAVGSNVFASGTLTPETHQKTMDLIARQQGFLDEYSDIVSDEWDNRLKGLNDSEAAQAVERARKVLVNGAYGGKIEGYTGAEWFELTTKRIDALKDLEFELVTHLQALTQQQKASADAAAMFVMLVSLVVLGLSIAVSALLVHSVVKPIVGISNCLDRLANGDMSAKIEYADRADEVGMLAKAAQTFRKMAAQRESLLEQTAQHEKHSLIERRRVMSEMATQVEDATHTNVAKVVALADSLTDHVMDMQKRMSEVSETSMLANSATAKTLEDTQQASSLAAELSAAISEVAENIVNGDRLARDAVAIAGESLANVEQLDAATQQINDFVRIISELADQTNLLALNATIESARAGEAGRGFAVVASEIKELASQTTRSASEITDRVNKIQNSTKAAVTSINRISASINSIGEMTSSISAAVEQQRVSTASFAEFLGNNRVAIEDVAKRVTGLNGIAVAVSERSTAITEKVAEMAEVSREADTSIPVIIKKAVEEAESRREPRLASDAAIVLADESGVMQRPAQFKDLSAHGARISAKTEGKVKVRLPDGLGEVTAKTAWSNDKESGLEFDEKVEDSLIVRLIKERERNNAA